MNIRIVKVDVSGIETQLMRIADMLECLIYATNPPDQAFTEIEDKPENRAFYTNDDEEIIAHKLRQMGREYRPRPK